MQTQPFLTEIIHFKDEIFKTIRLLENRLTQDINEKFTQSNIIYESFNDRLNTISSNNDSLLGLITSQKLNLDKINEVEKFTSKIEQNILNNEIKLKQLSTEIVNLSNKCDKIMYGNLEINGYIGPGCQYKNIGEFIKKNIMEFSKLKNEKEKIKVENTNLKNRLDNIIKSTVSLVDNGIITCQKYSDIKQADIKVSLENRLDEYNEKNMSLRTIINKLELDYKESIGNLRMDMEKLNDIKKDIINMTKNEINEINDKIENITQEIKILKSYKKENNSNKSNIKKPVNNSIYNNVEEAINSNSKRKRTQKGKNSYNINKSNEITEEKNNISVSKEKNKNIKNEEDKKKEKEKIILENLEKIYPYNWKFNEEKIEEKEENKKEEKKEEKLIEKENNLLDETNIERKRVEGSKGSDIIIYINDSNKENYINKKTSQKNENKKEEKYTEKHINNINDNIKNISENDNQTKNTQILEKKIIEQKNINTNNKNILQTKIKIESLEKKKLSVSSGSGIFNISRNLKKDETDTERIKSINFEESVFGENKSNINKNIKKIRINNIIPQKEGKEIENYVPIFQKFQNKDIINKMRQKNRNLISPTKSLNYFTKYEKQKQNNKNEEQKQIMDNIKYHYNIMKERHEQKSLENLVDCNVINLQLEKNHNKKRRRKNDSAKLYKNNLSEFGMKLSPAFGRTAYNFFIKNKLGETDSTKYGFSKLSNLKSGLNAAFITSIKNKINFQ